MTKLSVNINKVATLRNARGGEVPNVVKVALDCENFGADGITVHPRPDERHIRRSDVYDLRPLLRTEFNIEGYPAPEFIDLVLKVKPHQVTLVPDSPTQLTSNSGWDTKNNLEFLTARTNLARDFEALLAEHEFAPHRTRRNGVNLVYVKNSANLERLLRFMGAAGAAEEIHAQKAFKQVRNQTNRQTNCDTANLGKTARANAQTLRAIRYLQENDALETLPEVLQQAAAVRLQYPDLSLTALCGCFDPAVSKSGLSHRMKKLEALADALRQRVEKGQEAEP